MNIETIKNILRNFGFSIFESHATKILDTSCGEYEVSVEIHFSNFDESHVRVFLMTTLYEEEGALVEIPLHLTTEEDFKKLSIFGEI